MRGFYAIALTPFDEVGNLLWAELEREFDWIARCGAHGVVWPVNNSEQRVLTPWERSQGFELAANALNGRIPFVAGVAETSTAGAVVLAEAAGVNGADAVIALPPYAAKLHSKALIEDYFWAIADAADVPVFVQNLLPPVGSALSSRFIVELSERIPLVQYVKEERDPHGKYVSEVVSLAGPSLKGVFTGGHLLGLVNGHLRGAVGNIASCELSDVYAQIWDLMDAGAVDEARELQDLEAVFYRCMRTIPSVGAPKRVLVRRGVLSSDALRNTGRPALDELFEAELDHALEGLAPYLRV
jgi:4-hydroxy-tetrahydrodipicolinate synthase